MLNPNFEESTHVVFEMFDFDGDHQVSQEDIRTLLAWVPVSQILADQKDERDKGFYSKNGGRM